MNTTSLGLNPKDPSPIQPEDFPKADGKALAYDLIYSDKTSFLKIAKRKGYVIQDGRSMLLFQGAKAFEIWTGRKPPLPLMREALFK